MHNAIAGLALVVVAIFGYDPPWVMLASAVVLWWAAACNIRELVLSAKRRKREHDR